jgi:hypothetical protein
MYNGKGMAKELEKMSLVEVVRGQGERRVCDDSDGR